MGDQLVNKIKRKKEFFCQEDWNIGSRSWEESSNVVCLTQRCQHKPKKKNVGMAFVPGTLWVIS